MNQSLAFRRVDLNKMLHSRGIAGEGAPLVGLNIDIYASIAEHKTRRGESGIIGTNFSAEGAEFAVNACHCPVIEVHRGRWRGQSCQRFHTALVLWRVPPLQELKKENPQGQTGGKRHCHTADYRRQYPLHFFTNTGKETAKKYYLWHERFTIAHFLTSDFLTDILT